MFYYSLLACFLLSACAQQNQQVRVIQTPAKSDVYRFDLNPGDVVVCDKEACKVVRN